MPTTLTSISQHLFVYRGEINVGVIHRGEEALLIDIGDGSVLDVLHTCGIRWVDGVLFTHHHRDQAYGAPRVLAEGGWTGAPEAERALFEEVDAYWSDPKNRWHVYHFRPHHVPTEPVPIHRTFVEGDTLKWMPARITCLHTPGHTDGSMTYLLDVDGQRIAFCGDLIFDEGQIQDLYSLQKGFGGLTDYHGFMSAWQEAVASLRRIEAAGATVLVPSYGNIIRDPQGAVSLLEARLRALYENYLATSALWYYFPDLIRQQTPTAQPAVNAQTAEPASFLRHVGTSWMLRSDSGHLLVMDCGSEQVVEQIQSWIQQGDVQGVDALWVTHYHDDHVDAIPQFRERFHCPIWAEESVAQVTRCPSAWKLPCLSPANVPVDRVMHESERWQWREFILTAYQFPGQSLYHSGLLVEGHGLRLFFCGDSFTPTGMDDYCVYNRNLLGQGLGYERCLSLLEQLQPDWLLNCHVDEMFRFDSEHYQHMRRCLSEREQILRALLPWRHSNYGTDPMWACLYPYEQHVRAGQVAEITLRVHNYTAEPLPISGTLRLPLLWSAETVPANVQEVSAGSVGAFAFRVQVPSDASPGLRVLTADVLLPERRLVALAECLLRIDS
jgi:glyoxylase-like metal-dependent hydrolase (beta-lactamase superfamily II)